MDVSARVVWSCRILAAVLVLGSAAVRVAYLTSPYALDLSPDEAHYWDWSRHLDWSYYSKGPLVACLIRASCEVAGPLAYELLVARGAKSFADRGARPALPDDGGVYGTARRALPHDRRFALVGNADGGDVCGLGVGGSNRVPDDLFGAAEDLDRIVFDVAGLREDLAVFLLRARDRAGAVEQHAAR